MGVYAVVMVEKRRGISFSSFIAGLISDEWGKFALGWRDIDNNNSWVDFEWKDRRYFSWLNAPREPHLDLYSSEDYPDKENPVQLTFLKAMLVVERLAGGPVLIGNDVIYVYSYPPDEDEKFDDYSFVLPPKLDIYIPEWRKVEGMAVDDPHLIF